MRDYIDEDAVDKIKASIEDQMSSSSESEVKSKLVNQWLALCNYHVAETLSEILQCLLKKFIKGDALKLYHNEIVGINAFDWKKFPKALIVSDGKIQCDKIDDKITEIEELLDKYLKNQATKTR